jgi:hypothetical protein
LIVVGCVVLVGALVGVALYVYKRRQKMSGYELLLSDFDDDLNGSSNF